MNRGTKVVTETRQSKFERPRSTARDLLRFKNIHAQSRLRENNRSRKSVRPGADDRSPSIRVLRSLTQSRPPIRSVSSANSVVNIFLCR